jgi:hypothetical protein
MKNSRELAVFLHHECCRLEEIATIIRVVREYYTKYIKDPNNKLFNNSGSFWGYVLPALESKIAIRISILTGEIGRKGQEQASFKFLLQDPLLASEREQFDSILIEYEEVLDKWKTRRDKVEAHLDWHRLTSAYLKSLAVDIEKTNRLIKILQNISLAACRKRGHGMVGDPIVERETRFLLDQAIVGEQKRIADIRARRD